MIVGCIAAMAVHTLYNWSLDVSLMITLIIMVSGYIFYGWSLENGWWKKPHKKASR
jgi:RsiW-degrading membrane proteinase PrsW (M82 family)